jgi:Na+/H+-dicarboxylate symporter
MGVDRILDMSRTAINVSGDLVAAKMMDLWVGSSLSHSEEITAQQQREVVRQETGEDVITIGPATGQ